MTSVGLVPSSHQMERAASPTTSVPAFQRTVTQGSSHHLWQMGYQHLCLLTTKQQKGCQAIPSPGYGRLAASSAHCCVPVSASAAAQDHHHPFPSPNSLGSSPASDYPLCSLLSTWMTSATVCRCHESSDAPLELTASFRSSELIH